MLKLQSKGGDLMRCEIIIDKEREEVVTVCAHERTALVDDIERLVQSGETELTGYVDKRIYKLSPKDVYCFVSEEGKVFALTENGKYQIRLRLYQLEGLEGFLKINQSCLVNIKAIIRFDASLSGTLSVTLKNGYRDYVSRRQLKAVRERMEL